jgi:hypothetical protein
MPHGVNPAMKEVKTPGREAVLDGAGTEPECKQLSPRDHPMLPGGQLSK